jgi:hypothetical protein
LELSKNELSTILNAETRIKNERVVVVPSDKNLWSKMLFGSHLEVVNFVVSYISIDEALNITVFSGKSFFQEVDKLILSLVKNLEDYIKNNFYFVKGVFWNHVSC